jgi:Flagellar basal body protein FlaE
VRFLLTVRAMKHGALACLGLLGCLVAACGVDGPANDGRMSENWQDATDEIDTVAEALTQQPSSTRRQRGIPFCPAHATTYFAMQGNLNSSDAISLIPFDLLDPTNTSNAPPASLSVFDAQGRIAILDIYFAKASSMEWEYHILFYTTKNVEVGSGLLEFTSTGALEHWTEWTPLRLPSADGGEPQAIALNLGHSTASGGTGLDGMTSVRASTSITGNLRDGNAAQVGYECTPAPRKPRRPPVPDVAASTFPDLPNAVACDAQATVRSILSGNLSTLTHERQDTWDRLAPEATSDVNVSFTATDGNGTGGAFRVFFRRETATDWTYHVLLDSSRPGRTVASGTLQFATDGRLRDHSVVQAFRFPTRAGAAIALEFGTGLDEGGTGFDGITAFPTASLIRTFSYGGTSGWLGQECGGFDDQSLASSSVSAITPACAAVRTTYVSLSADGNEALPIMNEPFSVDEVFSSSNASAPMVVYDALGAAHSLLAYYRHNGPYAWSVHLIELNGEKAAELWSAPIAFDPGEVATGWAHEEETGSVGLALPTGWVGPPFIVNYYAGVFRAFSTMYVSSSADGRAADPSVANCGP